MVKEVTHNGEMLALIISSQFSADGIRSFTPDEFSQQLVYMKRPEGYVISPHAHAVVSRSIRLTQEVLFIKRGKVRVDLFAPDGVYVQSCIVSTGDVVLMVSGGHGFKMLEESEIFEVKQGPYMKDQQKISIVDVPQDQLRLK